MSLLNNDALELYPDPLILVDKEGTILLANTEAGKLFGYTPDELVGATLDLLLPRRFREVHSTHLRLYFNNPLPRSMGAGLEIYGLTRDEREIPLDISLKPQDGAVLASIRDISSIRHMQEELDTTKKALHNLQQFAGTINRVVWLVVGSIVGQVIIYLIVLLKK